MAGELWRSVAAVGKQVDPNVGVAATRRMYVRDPMLTKEADARPFRTATGTRDNVRALRKGPFRAGGSFAVPVSANEMVEPLLMTVNGGVVPTQPDPTGAPGAYRWLFKPGPVLDVVSLEYNDGANDFRGIGYNGNSLAIAGSVNDENVATFDLFGRDRVRLLTGLTAGLPERLPTYFEGWETELYIDPFGDTPGTTLITDSLISWNVDFNNQMGRKYFGQNTKAARGITTGELEITASIVFEAASAAAIDMLTAWEEDELMTLMLKFGQNNNLGGTTDEMVAITIPGGWTTHDASGEDEGTRTYEMELTYVYEPTLGAGIQFELINERATAYAA
jgi:hypothetical protein